MRTIICVVAHNGDIELYQRHYDLWEKHGISVLPHFPENGGKNHVARWRELLERLVVLKADRFVLFEPDSFCLSKTIPEFYVIGPDRKKRFDVPMLVGNVRSGPNSHPVVSATHYVLHPIILTSEAVKRLLERWRAIPDDFEGGHSDRTLFRLAQQSGVRIADFHQYGLGYGQIRIFPSDYLAMQEAIRNGAVMVHGVKEADVLDLALKAVPKGLQVPEELPLVDDMTACWIPGPFYGYLLKDLDSKFREWFAQSGKLQEQYPELAIGLRK